jgi:hypothetical protein
MRQYSFGGRFVNRILLCVLLAAPSCIDDLPPRACTRDGDCLQSGAAGTCLPSPSSGASYCVFPSTTCTNGAWGVLSGDGLAKSCYQGQRPLPDAPLAPDAAPGGSARLAIDPDDADFGTVVAGMSSSDLVFKVVNRGDGTSGLLSLATGGRDAADFIVVTDLCTGIALGAGGSCTLKVRFRPAAMGAKTATVGVSATPGGIVLATIGGTSAPPGVLTINPATQDFGSVLQGTAGMQATLTVRNTSQQPTSVSAALGGGVDFALGANGCTGTLAALASCTIVVRFQPQSAAALHDALVVTDGAGGTAVAQLTGTGLGAAALAMTPGSHDFGALAIGGQSAATQFTVRNGGGVAAGALSVQSSDPASFVVDASGCAATLAPGATCTLSVRFAAIGAEGAKSATLLVAADPGGSAMASLSGTALGGGALAITPGTQDFGALALGAAGVTRQFLVQNTGDSSMALAAPALDGNDPTSFTIATNDCPAMLDGGASCHVSVTFAPASVGAKSVSLTAGGAVATLNGAGTAGLTLLKSGTGTGTVTSSPAGIDCGGTCSATFAVATVTLTATPDATSDLTSWSGGGCSGTGTCTVTLDAAKTVTASFTARAATLGVTPASQDFGAVTLGGTSSTIDFTVTNSGGAASAPIAPMVSDASYAVTGGTCSSAPLGAGASCTVSVRFAPTGTSGPKSASLSVAGGAAGASLTGSALDPGALTLSPTTKDFGLLAVGSASSETTFTVTNTGGSTTGALSVVLSDATSFTVSSNTCTGTLAAGASCSVGVKLTPKSVGAKQGVSLTVSASPGGNGTASLQGEGTAQVTVTNGGGGSVSSSPAGISCGATCTATFDTAPVTLTATPDGTHTFGGWSGACTGTGDCGLSLGSAANGVTATFTIIPAALTLTPTSQDFGSVTLGQSSSSVDFTAKNTGGATTSALTVGASDPSYGVTGTCAGATLAAGATCKVTVTFAPTGMSGAKPATLTVSASDGGMATASLTGTALTAGALAMAPSTTQDFGQVAVGATSSAIQFTVTNTGQSPTGTLSMPSVGAGFAIGSTDCVQAPLAAGASCHVSVSFAPTSVGAATGSVTISASPGGTASTSLSGTGTTTVTVTNAGGGAVTSTPAGISCGTTCMYTFTSGTSITLHAAADGTHTFSGWSGDCSGMSDCVLMPLTSGSYASTATFAAAPAVLTISPTSWDFGSVAIGSNSATKTFTVMNVGAGVSGTISASVSDMTNYTVTGGTCAGTQIAGGASCTVIGRFNPTGQGGESATLSVTASPGGPVTSPLSGCGALTCGMQGWNCGQPGDGCGGSLSCGTCTSPNVCGAGGDNVCGTSKAIFVTNSTYDGNLGGIAGADSKCASDLFKPSGGGTYKALLVDGTNRIASLSANAGNGQVNWVLHPDTAYRSIIAGGIYVGTTNTNALFSFPLESSIGPFGGSASRYVWTGLTSGWQTSSNACTGWTSNNSSLRGVIGDTHSTTSTEIASGTDVCGSPTSLVCVEQ